MNRKCAAAGLAAALLWLSGAGAATAGDFDHSEWDRILSARVSESGLVAYRDLKSRNLPALDAYLGRVAAAKLDGWSRADRQAFFINAYNACAVRGVLNGRTAESLVSRVAFFGTDQYTIAGEKMSLDHLEKRVILPEFKDPRNHFALVCASASCPKLARRAYTGAALDAMLDAQGRDFLGDKTRNPLGPGPNVGVSMIFKWYADDFVGTSGSVAAFIAPFAPAGAPACLATSACSFEFLDYDWTLNAQPGQRP